LEKGKYFLNKIWNRTYGQVFKAKSKVNGKIVAIKKFKESDEDDEHVNWKIYNFYLGQKDCASRDQSPQGQLTSSHSLTLTSI